MSINGVQNFGTKISTQTVIIQTNMNHHVIRNQFLFNFLLRLKIVTWSRRQKIVHKSTIICPPRQLDFVAWIELDWIEFSTGILFETWMRWNEMWVFRLRVGPITLQKKDPTINYTEFITTIISILVLRFHGILCPVNFICNRTVRLTVSQYFYSSWLTPYASYRFPHQRLEH